MDELRKSPARGLRPCLGGWLLVLPVFISSCSGQRGAGPTVHFILPADFNGPFVVAVLHPTETSVRPNTFVEFRIPNDGVLIVDDDSVLFTWHTELVSTTDGRISRVMPIDGRITGRIGGHDRVFLDRGSGHYDNSGCRQNWFYFGAPGGENDGKKIDSVDAVLGKTGRR
jgi:hypothetical protein